MAIQPCVRSRGPPWPGWLKLTPSQHRTQPPVTYLIKNGPRRIAKRTVTWPPLLLSGYLELNPNHHLHTPTPFLFKWYLKIKKSLWFIRPLFEKSSTRREHCVTVSSCRHPGLSFHRKVQEHHAVFRAVTPWWTLQCPAICSCIALGRVITCEWSLMSN